MTIVYISWEGRGYMHESLFAYMAVAARHLAVRGTTSGLQAAVKAAHDAKPTGMVYFTFYDVGMLLSDSLVPDFTKVISTRHGQEDAPEDWTQNADLQDFDEYVGALKGGWEEAEDLVKLFGELVQREAIS